jgi:PKD repeat protein
VLPANNTISAASETVLLDRIPSTNGNHNAGDLNFGKDGLLYITAGDAGTGGSLARQRNNLAGKILRLNADGTPASSNPWFGEAGARRCGDPAGSSGTGNCQEIFAYGLRNPYRFAFDPNAAGTRFFINDVGQGTWEEISEGQAGADYGWNVREGPCPNGQNCDPASNLPSAYADPLHWYGRSVGASITGGAFVPDGIGWPAAYTGAYLFSDYVSGNIFRINRTSTTGINQWTRTNFATNLGGSSAVHLRFGPFGAGQALYYTTYASGGEVRRISVSNSTPTAVITASPTFGASPLTVNFDGSQSSDPDAGQTLTYEWDFGNGITATTSSPTISHTYTVAQPTAYTGTLVVRDNVGSASAPATVIVWPGNFPPAPTIAQPADGATFGVGQTINLSGSASDAQTTTLAWEVLLHHIDELNPGNEHVHPLFNGSGPTGQFTAPQAEDFRSTALSFLEVRLTATDSLGLSATVTRTVQPRRVTLTFNTQPAGLTIGLRPGSASLTDPAFNLTGGSAITSWEDWAITASPVIAQSSGGVHYIFNNWQDGNTSFNRAITTPAGNTTYTAVFVQARVLFLPIIRR